MAQNSSSLMASQTAFAWVLSLLPSSEELLMLPMAARTGPSRRQRSALALAKVFHRQVAKVLQVVLVAQVALVVQVVCVVHVFVLLVLFPLFLMATLIMM